MARRFAKVSEEEIEEAYFFPSDLVNTKTTIPLRVGEERWIYLLFTSPSGDSCILLGERWPMTLNFQGYFLQLPIWNDL